MKQRHIIVTDLDGTLLDHFNYSADPVLPVLQQLQDQGIPVIFNTSKTATEVVKLRDQLRNTDPFITETGSAAFIPEGYFEQSAALAPMTIQANDASDTCYPLTLGKLYKECVAALDPMKPRFRFRNFATMSEAEICDVTGLQPDQARMAKQRQHSEPVLWEDSDDNKPFFINELEHKGFRVLQGGRFLHVMGQTDKGQAMNYLKTFFSKEWKQPCTTIVLGDSNNDLDMLRVADIAVTVRSPVHEPPAVSGPGRVIVTTQTGPAGWAEAIRSIIPGIA
jgi:mannosyl-3-phosphoglycerate phosphatase family protein